MITDVHKDKKALLHNSHHISSIKELPVKAKPFNHQAKAYEKVCFIFGFYKEVV